MALPVEFGYTLAELATRTGLAPRTIHFYRAQGLLPRADRRGAGARYPQPTLDRLLAIQRLKSSADLTLQEIRRVLSLLSEERVAAFASGGIAVEELLGRRGGDAGGGPGRDLFVGAPTPPATLRGESSAAGAAVGAPGMNASMDAAPVKANAPHSAADAPDAPHPVPDAPDATPALRIPRDASSVNGEATAQLSALLRAFESGSRRSVPRAGSRDHWFSVPITADLQLSAHRVSGEDIDVLRRIADHIRALLVSGFGNAPGGSRSGDPPAPVEGSDPGSSKDRPGR